MPGFFSPIRYIFLYIWYCESLTHFKCYNDVSLYQSSGFSILWLLHKLKEFDQFMIKNKKWNKRVDFSNPYYRNISGAFTGTLYLFSTVSRAVILLLVLQGIEKKNIFWVLSQKNDRLDNLMFFGNLHNTWKDSPTFLGGLKNTMHYTMILMINKLTLKI